MLLLIFVSGVAKRWRRAQALVICPRALEMTSRTSKTDFGLDKAWAKQKKEG